MWTKENIPDQSGKTAIVTGANSGIGYETALALYENGAHVIIACRDERNANSAMEKMISAGGKGSLEIALLDLASLASIKQFADQVLKRHHQLNLLINNAGVMMPPESKTTDGYELQFGVNFLGHFALTGYLYPLLKQTPASRVIALSSAAYQLVAGIDFENLKSETSYDAHREYGISKFACLQFMLEFNKRLAAAKDDIISAAAHPGVTETDLSRHMPAEVFQAAVEKFGPLMPAAQGALPTLYAATAPGVKGGDYYGPDGEYELKGYPAPALVNDAVKDSESGKKLWEVAQDLTGIFYP